MLTWKQILLTLQCNIATLTFGLQLGWLAPLQPALQSVGSSPLGTDASPLTDDEISWIGAIPGLITPLGAPIFGYTLDKLGRKVSLLLCTAPNIVTYLLLIFANNIYVIYVSRVIGGICSCGGLIVGSMYIIESVEPRWRGTLGGMTAFSINLGVIISFIFGSYTSYLTLNLVSLSFTIFFVVCYPFISESPLHYMRKGQWLNAEQVYREMWGEDDTSQTNFNDEILEYRSHFDENQPGIGFWKILKTLIGDKGARWGLLTVLVIISTEMFSGYPAIISFTVDIFMKTGTIFSPYLAAVLVSIGQLIFAFIGAILIEKLGRRGVLIYFGPVMVLSLALTAIYLYLKESYPENSIILALAVLPTITLIIVVSACASSFGAVAFVVIPEYFTPEVRSTACTILNLWYAIAEFLAVKFFPEFENWIAFSGICIIYATVSLFGVMYVLFFMIETKGLDFKTIQIKLQGKRE